MRLLRRSLVSAAACCAALAVAAGPASAAITLVNAGFETGSTRGWHGSGSVARSYAGYTAPAGDYFGLVRSPGCPGEELEQELTANEGDVLEGWAFFRTGDVLPYDDDGAVELTLEPTGDSDVVFRSSVSQVGNAGATPWTTFRHVIAHTGSYTLRVKVENGLDCAEESAVGIDLPQGSLNADADAIPDDGDNCPLVANPDQANHDGDDQGDACDADDDNDTFDDEADNCPLKANSAQADTDGDGDGDACDVDDDNDTVNDTADNCQLAANAEQTDTDADGQGDACDADDDNDTVFDSLDNCPLKANSDQADRDGDGHGDACDPDNDNDNVADVVDNCPLAANVDQSDDDGDGLGDACDLDNDNDGVVNDHDNCPLVANPGQRDDDRDGIGNACDEEFDSGAGRATGGGWIMNGREKVNFSVSAKSVRGVLDGTCAVTVGRTKIKCRSVDGYFQAPNDVRAVIVGEATVDAVHTRYRMVLTDRGEPGREDRFRITTDSGFRVAGVLGGGNIQVRHG